jgi:hypothetical protein
MGCWLTGDPFIETAYRRAVIDKMGAAGGK